MDNLNRALTESRTGKRHFAAVLLVAALFGGLFWAGYRPWKQRHDRLYAASPRDERVVVTVAKVARASGQVDVQMNTTLAALTESPIYARSEGYVKARYADIGDRVKAGQLLVEIDSPELDELLRQTQYRYNQFKASSGSTQAAYRVAEANLNLAEVTLARTKKLVAEGVFSQAELDDKQAVRDVRFAEVASAKAAVEAAEEGKKAVNSDIERTARLSEFKKVVAPFSGVITARNCEVGNLINAAAVAAGRELYRVADPSTMRVLVNVPQPVAPAMRTGLGVDLLIPEYPGRSFPGRLVRTADSLDPQTRTLLIEVHVNNKAGELKPGMYGEVRVATRRESPPLLIPGDTAVGRSDGTYVAVVRADDTVHYQRLVVGRDLGGQIEVTGGLDGTERLVVNPSDQVQEGVKVVVAAAEKK